MRWNPNAAHVTQLAWSSLLQSDSNTFQNHCRELDLDAAFSHMRGAFSLNATMHEYQKSPTIRSLEMEFYVGDVVQTIDDDDDVGVIIGYKEDSVNGVVYSVLRDDPDDDEKWRMQKKQKDLHVLRQKVYILSRCL